MPDTDLTKERALQYLFDSLVGLVFLVPGLVVFVAAAVAEEPGLVLLGVGSVLVLSLVGSIWIWILRPVRHHGQTYGMSLLDIRVVDLRTLGEATLGQQTIRWLLLGLVEGGFIGLLLIAVTERHQRLGDMAAKTLVVRVDDPVVAAATGAPPS